MHSEAKQTEMLQCEQRKDYCRAEQGEQVACAQKLNSLMVWGEKLFILINFDWIWLFYNVVLISTVLQSESVIRVHISSFFLDFLLI